MGVTNHLEDIYNSPASGLCCWTQDINDAPLPMFNIFVIAGRCEVAKWVCFTLALDFHICLRIFLALDNTAIPKWMELLFYTEVFTLSLSLSLHVHVFVKYILTLSYHRFLVLHSNTPAGTLTSEDRSKLLRWSHLLWALPYYIPGSCTSSKQPNDQQLGRSVFWWNYLQPSESWCLMTIVW